MAFSFQGKGGAILPGSFYVERPIDHELRQRLLGRDLCFVLAPRQIGKSSLRVKTQEFLRERGVRCASIDLNRIGAASEAEWYPSVFCAVLEGLEIEEDGREFWNKHEGLSAVARWSAFLKHILEVTQQAPIVLFIDELDRIQSVPSLRESFFGSLRAAYERRAEDQEYARLTFCLLGVATPDELMPDPRHTPFNVGHALELNDFSAEEAHTFLPGLNSLGGDPQRWLDAVLAWTEGHPYMTQKLCAALVEPNDSSDEEDFRTLAPEEVVAKLNQTLFLEKGDAKDADPNLLYAKSRLLDISVSGVAPEKSLNLYRRVLTESRVAIDEQEPTQGALRLCGMVARRKDEAGYALRVRNRIFATVFDLKWVQRNQTRGQIFDAVNRWLDHARHSEYLLRGADLTEARLWAKDREDLSAATHEFLELSQDAERRRSEEQLRAQYLAESARQKGKVVRFWLITVVILCVMVSAIAFKAFTYYQKANAAQQSTLELSKNLERLRIGSLIRLGRSELITGEQSKALAWLSRSYEDSEKAKIPDLQSKPLRILMHQAMGGVNALIGSFSLGASEKFAGADMSPDGNYLAAFGEAGTVVLWNTVSGQEVNRWKAPPPLLMVDFPRTVLRFGGTRLFLLDAAGRMHAFFPHQGKEIYVQEADASTMAVSPDGRRLITCGESQARLWDTATGRKIAELSKHKGNVFDASFSHDGSKVATAAEDGSVIIWNAQNGSELAKLDGPQKIPLTRVRFDERDQRIVAGGNNGILRLWDPATRKVLADLNRPGDTHEITALGFSSDGEWLASTTHGSNVVLWDINPTQKPSDWKFRFELQNDTAARTRSIVFSRDNRWIFSAGDGGTTQGFETRSGRPIVSLEHSTEIRQALLTPDGARLLTAGPGGARLWDLNAIERSRLLDDEPRAIYAAAFSPDSRVLATAGADPEIFFWDTATGKLLRRYKTRQQKGIRSLTWSKSGRGASGGFDGTIGVFSIAVKSVSRTPDQPKDNGLSAKPTPPTVSIELKVSIEDLRHFSAAEELISSVMLSADGKQLLSASDDKGVCLWDTETEALLWQSPIADPIVHSAFFSPREDLVLTALHNHTAQLLNAKDGLLVRQIGPQRGPLLNAEFSPDGQRIVTASADHMATIWDAKTGESKTTLSGHTGQVRTASFSPDGQYVVTAGADKRTILWDAQTGQLLSVFSGHNQEIFAALFSPDGKSIATASADTTARLWSIELEQRPAADLRQLANCYTSWRVQNDDMYEPTLVMGPAADIAAGCQGVFSLASDQKLPDWLGIGRARTLTALGKKLYQAGRTEEAIQAFERALGLYNKAGERQPLEELYWFLGNANFDDLRIERARENFLTALNLSIEHGNKFGGALAKCRLARREFEPDPEKARRLHNEARLVFEELNAENALLAEQIAFAVDQEGARHWDEANRYANEGLQLALKTSNFNEADSAYSILTSVAWRTGKFSQAKELSQRRLALCRKQADKDCEAKVLLAQAVIRFEAHEPIETLLTAFENIRGRVPDDLTVIADQIELLHAAGRWAEVRKEADNVLLEHWLNPFSRFMMAALAYSATLFDNELPAPSRKVELMRRGETLLSTYRKIPDGLTTTWSVETTRYHLKQKLHDHPQAARAIKLFELLEQPASTDSRKALTDLIATP